MYAASVVVALVVVIVVVAVMRLISWRFRNKHACVMLLLPPPSFITTHRRSHSWISLGHRSQLNTSIQFESVSNFDIAFCIYISPFWSRFSCSHNANYNKINDHLHVSAIDQIRIGKHKKQQLIYNFIDYMWHGSHKHIVSIYLKATNRFG